MSSSKNAQRKRHSATPLTNWDKIYRDCSSNSNMRGGNDWVAVIPVNEIFWVGNIGVEGTRPTREVGKSTGGGQWKVVNRGGWKGGLRRCGVGGRPKRKMEKDCAINAPHTKNHTYICAKKKMIKKRMQHVGFPGGPPPQY